jgi:hypothetical protein
MNIVQYVGTSLRNGIILWDSSDLDSDPSFYDENLNQFKLKKY